MKRITVMLAIASAMLGASVGVAVASGAHIASSVATVGTRHTSLGTILVGTNGHTLYLDSADSKNKATCTGGCAAVWPPLMTSGKPKAKGSAKASDLGTIKSGSGKQVTYKGHPLYYFASDTAAGQTTGEGSNGFYVVSPSGKSITKSPASTGACTDRPGGACAPRITQPAGSCPPRRSLSAATCSSRPRKLRNVAAIAIPKIRNSRKHMPAPARCWSVIALIP